MSSAHFDINNFRLLIKGLITAWVPVGILLGLIPWDAQAATVVMGASTLTVDLIFRVWHIEDPTTMTVAAGVHVEKDQ